MSCKRKTKNTAAQTNSAASVSTVFAVPEADEAGEAAVLGAQTELAGETAEADESAGGTSPWSDVSMRRYVHPIPAACTGCGCQSCPCQSCTCRGYCSGEGKGVPPRQKGGCFFDRLQLVNKSKTNIDSF